jgi:hypothetical protein
MPDVDELTRLFITDTLDMQSTMAVPLKRGSHVVRLQGHSALPKDLTLEVSAHVWD